MAFLCSIERLRGESGRRTHRTGSLLAARSPEPEKSMGEGGAALQGNQLHAVALSRIGQ
jgi:hypothetical protein